MKIDTVVTKVHTAVFSADDLKTVAISAVKSNLGLGDAASYEAPVATIGDDGSIKVEIVESVPVDAPVADPATPSAPPIAPSIVIPTGLGGAAPTV